MFQMIQPEMTRRECSLVNDILDMFSTLEPSMERLTDEERASSRACRARADLPCFDFNNSQEARLATYARYLISTSAGSRWPNTSTPSTSPGTRTPHAASYERMLSVWRPI